MQIYMYIALYCDARIAVLRVLLLFIGIIPNPNPILPWTSCLELEKLLQFSTSVIFFFFFSLLSISSQAKEMGFIHFLPLILNCKLQKIPLQNLHFCSCRFSGTSLISWLESLLLMLWEWLSIKLKFDNIFTTAVLFVVVSPSALKGPECTMKKEQKYY